MTTPSFRLTGLLESGELAELFRATSAERGEVVVKLFHERTSDAHYARALVKNSGVLNTSALQGVVHWVDVGFVQRRLAVVREHVEGPLLGEALTRLHSRELLAPPPLALLMVLELLETMQQVHDAGIVHGALTPGNVMLSKAHGAPAIFDFGALHALMAVPQLKRTFVGRGRSAYRAPEVTRGELPDALSDVYSIGALAYELLTLHEPRIADGGASTRREGLVPPSRLDRRLNARLDPILLRALDPQPHRRFRTCADFAAGLRNYLTASGGLPSHAELRAFVDELTPMVNRTLGAAPFTDFFSLDGIDGLELPEVQDGLPTLDQVRPSFSGGAAPATDETAQSEGLMNDTVESPPAFAEFKPTRGPPPENEGTDPGGAGPLERGWEAPPSQGPLPQARRRPALGSEATVVRSGRNPRVKVVEDFQGGPRIDPSPAYPPAEKTSAAPARPPPRGERQASGATTARPAGAPASRPAPAPVRIATPKNAAPPPGAVIGPSSMVDAPLTTGEAHVLKIEQRQRKMRGLSLAVGVLGLACFALAVGVVFKKDTGAPPRPSEEDPTARVERPIPTASNDAKVRALSSTIARFEKHGGREEDRDEADEVQDTPPPASKAAFLNLRTDVPAHVFVDGQRVSVNAPLERYPVWPGDRKVEVEDPQTGERRVFRISFRKGKAHSLDEQFGPSSP